MLAFKNFFAITFLILFESNFIDAKDPERIHGGYTTHDNELAKYAVSIRLYPEKEFGSDHFCGGSILKPNLIVTAAHCLVITKAKPEKLLVVAGAVYRTKKDATTQTRRVIKYTAHPSFNLTTLDYDIALLSLKKPLNENGVRVQRVNLNTKSPPAGKTCIAMGWGVTNLDGSYEDILGTRTDQIQYANKTIMLYASCKKKYYKGKFPQGVFCVYNKGGVIQNLCYFDEGAPLICDGKTLVGIYSYRHLEDCKENSPEFYTDIRRFGDFIKKTEQSFKSSCKSPETLLTLISLSICGVFLNYLQIF